jgi:hypothetical protein
MLCLRRFNVCAPAVVVLATVVNAAAASDCVFGAPRPAGFDTPCASGGSQSVRHVRTRIAKHAARAIDSVDKLSAVPLAPLWVEASSAQPLLLLAATPCRLPPHLDPASSTHQRAAP